MSTRGSNLHLVVVTLMGAALLALLLLSTLQAAPARADDDDDDGGATVPRQLVVKLKPNATIGVINNDRRYRTGTIDRLLGSKKIYLLRVPKGKNPGRVLNLMRNDRRIIYAEPNFRTGSPEGDRQHSAFPGGTPAPSSNPAPYRDQYAIGAMNLSVAHDVTRGAGSVVAVIDTGAQLNHPALAGSFTNARYDFIGDDRIPTDMGDGKDNDGDGDVDEMVGHGTHVAGIVKLTAPEARIMPLRALDTEGRGNIFVLAEAVQYATRNGADVVNMSLGSTRESQLIGDLIESDDDDDDGGGSSGPVFVAAAGNDNNTAKQFPAAEEDAIAVTSVDQNERKSPFANYGNWLTVAAPGSGIHSPFPTSRYAKWDGTSMATPFVAGQAALIKGVRPSASSECVVDIIGTTARPLDAANPTSAGRLGKGHADAGASAEYARATGCPPESDD